MITINGRKPITKREKCLCKAELYRQHYIGYKHSYNRFRKIKSWFYGKLYEYYTNKEQELWLNENY